jgi:hypothetical protein
MPEQAPEPISEDDPVGRALRQSALGRIAPGETPSAKALLGAMGGVLGIVESILPTLLFLIVYTVTKDLWWSVAAPVAISIVFIVIRIVRRQAVMTAIAGFLGVGISAAVALITGNAKNNFVPGFLIDGGIVVVMGISLLVRRPFLGVIVGFLIGDRTWRQDRAQIRVAMLATVLWLLLGAIRLAVELPFFVAGRIEVLATAKLILGVPLYAVILWLTWLLFRTAWTMPEREDESSAKS